MNQLVKTFILPVNIALGALPWAATEAASNLSLEHREHAGSYDGVTGYTLEKHANISPLITVHFDHCPDSPMAREMAQEKNMATGIIIGNNRVIAPADDFIDPCSPPIFLPKETYQTSNHYFCHDQRVKKITQLFLIAEQQPEPESDSVEDNPRHRAWLATPKIVRVLNELNFDGSSTVDALLCHKTENGAINPKPAVAVLSLSEKAARVIPPDAATATIAASHHDFESGYSASGSLLLRNQTHFYNADMEAEPDSDAITQLIAAARQWQRFKESSGKPEFNGQPFAFITHRNGKHHLKALINDWELIDTFPSLYSLPDYAQRHPYASKLWKGTSPLTGTISHALGMGSVPGITGAAEGVAATVELIGAATVIYLMANYLPVTIPAYPIMKTGLGLIILNGFYHWATSTY